MGEEKLYIGSKLIRALEMDRKTFENTVTKKDYDNENEPGYRVTYPDGYVSWSPKSVFENAYREVTKSEKELF